LFFEHINIPSFSHQKTRCLNRKNSCIKIFFSYLKSYCNVAYISTDGVTENRYRVGKILIALQNEKNQN